MFWLAGKFNTYFASWKKYPVGPVFLPSLNLFSLAFSFTQNRLNTTKKFRPYFFGIALKRDPRYKRKTAEGGDGNFGKII